MWMCPGPTRHSAFPCGLIPLGLIVPLCLQQVVTVGLGLSHGMFNKLSFHKVRRHE